MDALINPKKVPDQNGNISIKFVCLLNDGDLEFTQSIHPDTPFREVIHFIVDSILTPQLAYPFFIQPHYKNTQINFYEVRSLAELGIKNGDDIWLRIDKMK